MGRTLAGALAAAWSPVGLAQASAPAVPAVADAALARLHLGDIGSLLLATLDCGGEPGRWLIDSGATAHLVSQASASRWALEPAGRSSTSTAGATTSLARVRLPVLTGFGARFEGQTALVAPSAEMFGPSGVVPDGVLGLPALALRPLQLDLRRDRISSIDATAVATSALEVPLDLDGGLPTAMLALGGRPPQPFLFDTGFAGALLVFASRVDAGLQQRMAALPDMMFRELGGEVRATPALFGRVALGGYALERVPAAIERGNAFGRARSLGRAVGIVGLACFRGAVLGLDLPGRRLLLEPGSEADRALPGGFGLRMRTQPDGALIVDGLYAGGPAARAGFAPGERLLRLDGVPVPPSVDRLWAALDGRDQASFEREHRAAVTLRREAFFTPLD